MRYLGLAAVVVLLASKCEGNPGSAPQPFALLSPSDGQAMVPVAVTFQWESAIRADTYTIEIGTDVAFAGLLFSQDGLTVPTYVPPADLPLSTTVFWRVTAFNDKGSYVTSTDSFNVVGIPGLFTLTTPAHMAGSVAVLPTYAWSMSGAADTYVLEVDLDAAFTAPIAFTLPGITTTSTTPSFTLNAATTYFWRVTAVNGSGQRVATGAPFQFTTS